MRYAQLNALLPFQVPQDDAWCDLIHHLYLILAPKRLVWSQICHSYLCEDHHPANLSYQKVLKASQRSYCRFQVQQYSLK